MNKLSIEFDPTQEWVSDEVKIAPPYSFLSDFLESEPGRRVDAVRDWMQCARDALDGKEVYTGYGNGWAFRGNARMIKFETLNGNEYTIPTPLLLEAFERYLIYLEARGFPSTKPTPAG